MTKQDRWSSADFKHRRYEKTHDVAFYKNGAASEMEGATTAVLEIRAGIYSERINFAWPADKERLSDMERVLALTFEAGRRDKADEVRKVLGVENARH